MSGFVEVDRNYYADETEGEFVASYRKKYGDAVVEVKADSEEAAEAAVWAAVTALKAFGEID